MLHYQDSEPSSLGIFRDPQASDGDVAIASSALLDVALRELLLVALPGDRRTVREFVRPYTQRKMIAYCMGLISYAEYRDLRLVARIRNQFAHDMPRPIFAEESITRRCEHFSVHAQAQARNWSNRRLFVETVLRLAVMLHHRWLFLLRNGQI